MKSRVRGKKRGWRYSCSALGAADTKPFHIHHEAGSSYPWAARAQFAAQEMSRACSPPCPGAAGQRGHCRTSAHGLITIHTCRRAGSLVSSRYSTFSGRDRSMLSPGGGLWSSRTPCWTWMTSSSRLQRVSVYLTWGFGPSSLYPWLGFPCSHSQLSCPNITS